MHKSLQALYSKPLELDPSFLGPSYYMEKFGQPLMESRQKITFNHNGGLPIHNWTSYVQGFSGLFVQRVITEEKITKDQIILDPFVGSGTVSVTAKMNGIPSIGIELSPLLAFAAKVKTNWGINVEEALQTLKNQKIPVKPRVSSPDFLLTDRHFNPEVSNNLLKLKGWIESIQKIDIHDLFKLAFGSILIDVSNLKRAPCLGYVKNKQVIPEAPLILFENKVKRMLKDLRQVQALRRNNVRTEIFLSDAKTFACEPGSIDVAITSPPYMNGMDYIINYKIELAWLNFVKSKSDLNRLKNEMVVCDNVSKSTIKDFMLKQGKYTDEWLSQIIDRIHRKIHERPFYRRMDMPMIVHKYFDDLWPVFQNVYRGLKRGGKFVLVVGDSLIADTYIPTDLLLARMGVKLGFRMVKIEKARERRSGQRRDFVLRETVTTLQKI